MIDSDLNGHISGISCLQPPFLGISKQGSPNPVQQVKQSFFFVYVFVYGWNHNWFIQHSKYPLLQQVSRHQWGLWSIWPKHQLHILPIPSISWTGHYQCHLVTSCRSTLQCLRWWHHRNHYNHSISIYIHLLISRRRKNIFHTVSLTKWEGGGVNLFNLGFLNEIFYRTQVSLGSDIGVRSL